MPVNHKNPPAVPEPSEAEGTGQALCRSCGMCCDGTLFPSVTLLDGDPVPALVAAGIKIVVHDAERRFRQPCAAHDGQSCRVYTDRPSVCRTSRCKVLVDLESHTIEWRQALEKIHQVFALKKAAREALKRIEPTSAEASLSELQERWARIDDAAESLAVRRKYGPVLVCMVAFEWYLEWHFFRERAAGDPNCAFSRKRSNAGALKTTSE